MAKKGFTLAETLVTLGIIGVVAIILISTVIKITPSKNRIMFKKAYSTLERTISALSNDDVNYPERAQGLSVDDGTTIPRGFNYTCKTGEEPSCTYFPSNHKFCSLFAEQLNTIGAANCDNDTSTFKSTDGIVWTIKLAANDAAPNTQFPLSSTSYAAKIKADVNGSADPNCTADTAAGAFASQCPHKTDCSDEPDIFIFGIRYDGKISVAETDACAALILSTPAQFTK